MPSKTASLFECQTGVFGPAPIDELGTAVSRCGPDQLRDRVDDATKFAVHLVGDHVSPNSAPSKCRTSQSSARAVIAVFVKQALRAAAAAQRQQFLTPLRGEESRNTEQARASYRDERQRPIALSSQSRKRVDDR